MAKFTSANHSLLEQKTKARDEKKFNSAAALVKMCYASVKLKNNNTVRYLGTFWKVPIRSLQKLISNMFVHHNQPFTWHNKNRKLFWESSFLTSSKKKREKKEIILLILIFSTSPSSAPFIMSDTGSALPSICLTLQEGNWCADPSEPHGSIYGMDPCF